MSLLFSGTAYADLGEFDGDTDVGRVSLKGTVQYDRQAQQYRIAGSGENIWATEDAFHFLWRRSLWGSRAICECGLPGPLTAAR